jgi:hypothetical protein
MQDVTIADAGAWMTIERHTGWYTIKPWRFFLQKAMPMQRRAFLWAGNVVFNSHL